jgi:phosphatidate cytidylyltransferase
VSDLYDDERSPTEGVRIIGAEEARASLGANQPVDDDEAAEAPDDEALLVDLSDEDEQLDLRVDEADDDEPLVASRKESATWSALGPDDILPGREAATERPMTSSAPPPAAVPAGDAPTGEVPKLPHWTEPPTGAVPAIFADDNEDEELDAWASVAGAQPRFRAEGSDWSDVDFAEDLSEEPVRLGAIGNEAPIDEEEQFARDLAAKRGPRRARAPRPAARPVRPEPETATQAASAQRDLPTAIMTAAAVAVVAIICFTRVWTTVALAAVIIGFATLELASSLHKRGLRPATPVALIAAATMPIAAYNYGTESYPVFFALVTIVSMLWFLWEITPGRPLPSVATTMLVFAYVGGLGGFAGLLLAGHDGVGLILGVALCVIAYDVAGFFVGSQFGHTAVAPKVSPHKTVEGTIAGMVASVLVGAVIAGQIAPWTPGKGAVLGVLVAVGAFVGDLCESMLKRDLGLKDFGALLPGHGGVLDRFDSLLFCLPIAYYLALQFKIF